MFTVNSLAVPPAVPLTSSKKSPAFVAVFWRVDEQVVVPSKPVVPAVLEQAIAPEAAVAKAPLNRLVVEPALLRPTITLGVPASAVTSTSRTVAAAGTKQIFFCGPN